MKNEEQKKKGMEKTMKLCRFIEEEEFIIRTTPIEEINKELKEQGIESSAFIERMKEEIGNIDKVNDDRSEKELLTFMDLIKKVFSVRVPRWQMAFSFILLVTVGVLVYQRTYFQNRGVGIERGIDHTQLSKFNHQDQRDLNELNHTIISLHTQQKYTQALELAPKVIMIIDTSANIGINEKASSLNNLAVLFKETEDYQKAEQLYLKALNLQNKDVRAGHEETLVTMNNLGLLYEKTQQFEKAKAMYVEMIKLGEQVYGVDHNKTVELRNNLAEFYQNNAQNIKP